MQQNQVNQKAIGRPRDEKATVSLLQATLSVLAESGYHAASLDVIAERARSSKATVYRRWSGKSALCIDAMRWIMEQNRNADWSSLHTQTVNSEDTTTGNVQTVALSSERNAVQYVLVNLIHALSATPLGGALRGLISLSDDTLDKEGFLPILREIDDQYRTALRNALHADTPTASDTEKDVVADQLLGAVYLHLLMRRLPLERDLALKLARTYRVPSEKAESKPS